MNEETRSRSPGSRGLSLEPTSFQALVAFLPLPVASSVMQLQGAVGRCEYGDERRAKGHNPSHLLALPWLLGWTRYHSVVRTQKLYSTLFGRTHSDASYTVAVRTSGISRMLFGASLGFSSRRLARKRCKAPWTRSRGPSNDLVLRTGSAGSPRENYCRLPPPAASTDTAAIPMAPLGFILRIGPGVPQRIDSMPSSAQTNLNSAIPTFNVQ